MADLKAHPLASIGIGWLRRKGWVAIRDGVVERAGDAPEGEDERALRREPLTDGPGLRDLLKRGLAVERETVGYRVAITPAGRALVEAGLDLREEVGQITHEMLLTGAWRDAALRRYRVDRLPRRAVPGKAHPYQRLLDEMRQILLEMGFVEMERRARPVRLLELRRALPAAGPPGPRDAGHVLPRREADLPDGWEAVRRMHEHGGETTSTGWGGSWQEEKAAAGAPDPRDRALDPVPRGPPETAGQGVRDRPGLPARDDRHDPSPEFEQLEGIVMDEGVTFSHLLGFLREFYSRIGFPQVRFRPGYFPYTEPSVEPEVYVEGLGWIEIGGAGVFREEVTAPLGLEHPVLAWGLGASRLAMLRLGLKDLRQLYRSDIDWIRETPIRGRR